MKWLKLGLLLSGGIGFVYLAVIFFFDLHSRPGNIAKFKTAAGMVAAPPAGQPLEMVLRPYSVKVMGSKGRTSLGFVSIRMVIADAFYWREVCQRLPKVREVLALSLGGKVLDRQDWFAVTGRAKANSLRKRINKTLKANYVEKVIVNHGKRAGGKGKLWFCPEAAAKTVRRSRR